MTKLEGLQERQMPGESTGGQQCYAVERLTTSVQPFLMNLVMMKATFPRWGNNKKKPCA